MGHIVRRLSLMQHTNATLCSENFGDKEFSNLFLFTFGLFQISSFLIARVNLSDTLQTALISFFIRYTNSVIVIVDAFRNALCRLPRLHSVKATVWFGLA